MEKEKVYRAAPRAPSKKPCRFFHINDCYRGDKCHMVHAPKDQLAPCQTHKLWLEDPWTRPPCEWEERCSRTHLPHTGPDDPDLRRTNIALQTENSQLSRVRTYAAEVLGAGGEGSVTGIARSGTSRYRQKLVLLEARDPEEFSRKCIADPSLCRSILRVYILGGGMCSSLEDVGKTLAAEVAAGKHVLRSRSSVDVADGNGSVASTVAPLLVRVQALPKVMERQLVDEESSFWDDNFPGLVRERREGIFTHVLSVIFVRGAFLYNLASASTYGRCIIENNREYSAVCRAFYKIKEVTIRAGISYSDEWTAIDMGSAPGGWTSFLAARCRRVLSVDPAELDPEVLALSNVIHVQQTAQAARRRLAELLKQEWSEDKEKGGDGVQVSRSPDFVETPSGGRTPRNASEIVQAGTRAGNGMRNASETVRVGVRAGNGADIVVSDMNAEPEVVADVLLSCMAAGLAKPGALLIATFKDFCGHKKMTQEVALAISRLEAGTAADADVDADVAVTLSSAFEDKCVVSREGEDDAQVVNWRLEGVQTMRLLSSGRTERTIVGQVSLKQHLEALPPR